MKGLIFFKIAIVSFSLMLASLGMAQPLDSKIQSEMQFEEININKADAETIAQNLTGIGLRKAEAIVAYREQNGMFSSVDDLIQVKGVGEFTVINNQERIAFE